MVYSDKVLLRITQFAARAPLLPGASRIFRVGAPPRHEMGEIGERRFAARAPLLSGASRIFRVGAPPRREWAGPVNDNP